MCSAESFYKAKADYYAFNSVASDVTDTLSVKGWDINVPGGKTQYYIPDRPIQLGIRNDGFL
jgi:hypothetical protein